MFNPVILVKPNVSNVTYCPREDQPQPNPIPSPSVVSSSISSSSLDQSSTVSSQVDKKKKGKGKKKKDKKEKKQQPSALDGARSKRMPKKPKFPCKICKGATFLRSVLVSPVYKKSGLKDPNHLCHQPLIIIFTILPQPVNHW